MDNFRDLGGIVTDYNKKIIEGKIFRSGALINLTAEERKYLNNLHIDEVFDLRSNAEQIARPDEPIAVIRSVPALPDIGTVLEPAALEELVMKADDDMLNRLIDKVQSLYEVIAFKNSAYSQVFDSMRQGRTFIFHCTAGKDRTGVLAALILILLVNNQAHTLQPFAFFDERFQGEKLDVFESKIALKNSLIECQKLGCLLRL